MQATQKWSLFLRCAVSFAIGQDCFGEWIKGEEFFGDEKETQKEAAVASRGINAFECWRHKKELNFLRDCVSSAMFQVGDLIGILSRGKFGERKQPNEATVVLSGFESEYSSMVATSNFVRVAYFDGCCAGGTGAWKYCVFYEGYLR